VALPIPRPSICPLELEIWGRAHLDYGDMVPLETVRRVARAGRSRLRMGTTICVDRSVAPRPSWLINDDEIAATGCRLCGARPLDRAVKVSSGPVAAYYSGSPDTGTVNVVRLTRSGQVLVERMELDIPREVEPSTCHEHVP